jgi:hypothetical protein
MGCNIATASGPTQFAHSSSSMNSRLAEPLVKTVRPPIRGRALNSAISTLNLHRRGFR